MKALWLRYRALVFLAGAFALAMWLAPCLAAKDRAARGIERPAPGPDRWQTGARALPEDVVWRAAERAPE